MDSKNNSRQWMVRWIKFSLMLMVAMAARVVAGADKPDLNFQEVFDLLKANVGSLTERQLNDAAARGLIAQMAGKVALLGEASGKGAVKFTNAPVSVNWHDSHFAHLRVNRMGDGVEKDFAAICERLLATNKLKGVVLDLRFADGQDYAAAAAMADRFLSVAQPLLDWGEGWRHSTSKTNAMSAPLVILVNHQTAGAAEALAGALRHRDVGLLIGTNTAGQASMSREFTLKTGQKLRLAIAPLKVADGQELPFNGIKADIGIEVSPEDELAWYEDAYKTIARPGRLASSSVEDAAASTNRAPRRRLNEAELVRMNREGSVPEREVPFTKAPVRSSEAPAPVVNDPALARALDLLKGLAVVQQFRSI
jgi:C-terminal processing protease CtpA/Prc